MTELHPADVPPIELVLGPSVEDLEALPPEPVVGLLGAAEERVLTTQVQAGLADGGGIRGLTGSAKAAFDTLVERNQKLVGAIARRYQHRGLDLPDLIQEGTWGLMHALTKFDPSLGFRLSTYACWWVRQAITRAIADQGRMVRLPAHAHELLTHAQRAGVTFHEAYGRQATETELALLIDVPLESLHTARRMAPHLLSLDKPTEEEGDTLGSTVAAGEESPGAALEHEELQRVLAALMEQELSAKERQIINLRTGLRYGQPHSLGRTSAEYGLCRERIRQIEGHAMQKLRRAAKATQLDTLLESVGGR